MDPKPIIETSEGYVQGCTLKSILGPEYFAFKGIPYAQPPTGPLRFKEPQPPAKWTGIRDASQNGARCIQYVKWTPKPEIRGLEDCLYLNIYTKSIGHKRPVMFFIHGGYFMMSTGNDDFFAPDYMVTQDMILVFINYRLGPFGFLNLGHEVAPGNQGLRDIIFALEWVKKNIESFGGDPNNITIMGNSAGAMISHLFTLLPVTKDLFHKAISISGTVFIIEDMFRENNFLNGFKIASLLGFESDDPVQVIDFLRTVPVEDLLKIEDDILLNEQKNILPNKSYAPVYDAHYTKNPLIPLPISELIRNDADIPIIIGHTKDETLLCYAGKYNDDTYKFCNDNKEEIVKNQLLCDSSKLPEIMNYFNEFYLKNKPINKDTFWNWINLTTDVLHINFDRKVVDFRNDHAIAPTYVYNFSYTGNEPTIYKDEAGPQLLHGVAHADELSYIFYLPYLREILKVEQYPEEGTKDRLVLERLIKMLYNFAATGNPTPAVDGHCITSIWKPARKNELNYLDIGDELVPCRDEDNESWQIYNKIRPYFFNY